MPNLSSIIRFVLIASGIAQRLYFPVILDVFGVRSIVTVAGGSLFRVDVSQCNAGNRMGTGMSTNLHAKKGSGMFDTHETRKCCK